MLPHGMTRRDIIELASDELGQHFLVAPAKLAAIRNAAGIRSSDRVLELGAGIGTIACALPECASLTLVELDQRLAESLRTNFPRAHVQCVDALEAVRLNSFDVLIGSLPGWVTERLIRILPTIHFRVAVLAVDEATSLLSLGRHLDVTEISRARGDDFVPSQKGVSRFVRLIPKPISN